jgi:hypothetical protein
VYYLARDEGIKNRLARGNRWIRAATYGVRDGKIVWELVPNHAGELPNFEEIQMALDGKGKRDSKL